SIFPYSITNAQVTLFPDPSIGGPISPGKTHKYTLYDLLDDFLKSPKMIFDLLAFIVAIAIITSILFGKRILNLFNKKSNNTKHKLNYQNITELEQIKLDALVID